MCGGPAANHASCWPGGESRLNLHTLPFVHVCAANAANQVLNASNDLPNVFEDERGTSVPTYCRIPVDDADDADIGAHFERSFEFISRALKTGGAVLVHCRQGVSRSATLVPPPS